jgi:twitching motility protein PilT
VGELELPPAPAPRSGVVESVPPVARGGTVLGIAAVTPEALANAAPAVVPRPLPGATGGTIVQAIPPPAALPHAADPPPASRPSDRPPKARSERPRAPASDAARSYLGRALAVAIQQGASDLHAHSGAPLLVRVDGGLRPLSGDSLLTAEAAEQVIAEVMTDPQWAALRRAGQVDFAYAIADLGRFRVNVYRQQRGLDIVFRIIAATPPGLDELGLPARLSRLCDYRTGIVLCTGPAGCGKSTTLAALVNLVVKSRAEHVLTIENPVEHVYPQGRALVNQREVGTHTGSFARALRAALREDPDVIVITELRDRETMGLAISAAETGHLVLGTLHTGNAGQTINRIVSSFPADEQEQMRVMLAESLRAVVSQRLLPAAGGGRVPAIELLMVNTAVSKLIRDDKTFQLPSTMQTGKAAGMLTLDDSIAALVAAGTVTREVAQRFAYKKERFA